MMNTTQSAALFMDLSTAESQTVQGGRCSRRSAFRPQYYYYRPSTPAYFPSFSYGYGYSGYGGGWSSGAVNQTVNVTVRYDD